MRNARKLGETLKLKLESIHLYPRLIRTEKGRSFQTSTNSSQGLKLRQPKSRTFAHQERRGEVCDVSGKGSTIVSGDPKTNPIQI